MNTLYKDTLYNSIILHNVSSFYLNVTLTSAKLELEFITTEIREHSGPVVECLTGDREAAGSSLTGVTVLWP